jgi:uroporphyrinogen-III synthase
MSEPEPLRVVSLESRRAGDMARLLSKRGMGVISAPSMQEVPLDDQGEALRFGERLMAGECDVLVLLTGVGLKALVGALTTRWSPDEVVKALGGTVRACRGPKPKAALRELGLDASLVAPEPNTWEELLRELEPVSLRGKRVFVQEYGRTNDALVAALRERGAEVGVVPVYAWALPDDLEPLKGGIAALCDGTANAVLFTSARQVDHVLQVARQMGREPALKEALRRCSVVASVGPVTSDALREAGLPVDVEPAHPKMGHLVKALADDGARALAAKSGN